MVIRKVHQYSDRGSIKDLINSATNLENTVTQLLPSDIRLQKLLEYANTYRDKDLLSSLGIITTDYISDKNALPLSVYRIRRMVSDIKAASPNIDQLSRQIAACFREPLSPEAIRYIQKRACIKTASIAKPPTFKRVSE